jgi:uncharacterized protein (DUF2062 family)
VSAAPNLFAQQAKNRRQTAAWIAFFVLFFAWLGLGGDAALYLGSIVSGVVLGLAFSMLVDVFWRLHVLHNWRKRSRTRGAA